MLRVLKEKQKPKSNNWAEPNVMNTIRDEIRSGTSKHASIIHYYVKLAFNVNMY